MSAAGLALALAAAATAAAVPAPFAGLPGLTFAYRPIAGDSVATLAAALEASADHPPGGGSSYANTRWAIDWHWHGRGPGAGCRITAVELGFSARVTLPQLAEPGLLDADTRARWEAFARAIATHEAGHAHLAHDGIGDVRAAILAATCDGADAAGRDALRAVQARQEAYDRATRNGAAQGARFP